MTHVTEPLDRLRSALVELADLHGVARTRAARVLSLEAMATISAAGDEGVYEATRAATYDDVAAELGLTKATVQKAIRRHAARQKALTVRTESGTKKRAKKA